MPLTVGENSYISVADASEYFALAVHGAAWVSADTSVREAALVSATRMLDRQRWSGSKASPSQALQWPRSGLTDRDGNTLSDATVPQEVVDATCELALSLIDNPDLQNSDNSGSNIKRVKADTVEVEYIRGKTGSRFSVLITELIGLWLAGSSYNGPFISGADNESGLSSTFDLTGGY